MAGLMGSMALRGAVRAAVPSPTAGVLTAGTTQKRWSRKVTFWGKYTVRSPKTLFRKPIMASECVRGVNQWYYMMVWRKMLTRWKTRLKRYADSKVSDYEAKTSRLPRAGLSGRVILKLLQQKKGYSLQIPKRLSMRDNPFLKSTSVYELQATKVKADTAGKSTRVQRVMEQGHTKAEAQRMVKEMRTKHKQGLKEHLKLRTKMTDYLQKGKASEHAGVASKLQAGVGVIFSEEISSSTEQAKGETEKRIPLKHRDEYQIDVVSKRKTRMPTPKLVMRFNGMHPIDDGNPIQPPPGNTATTPGSSTCFMGSSELDPDFVYPIHKAAWQERATRPA
eukprot:Sspe_Gene.44035::Locus_21563_Transcript_1_1_Confidence_1.000_Length_1151::g.44035::m.44035